MTEREALVKLITLLLNSDTELHDDGIVAHAHESFDHSDRRQLENLIEELTDD